MSQINGNIDHQLTEDGRLPHPLDGVIAENPKNDAILLMQTGLSQWGRKRALLSGTTKIVPEDVCALEEHARAMARQTYRERFDPSQHEHDRLKQDEHERDLSEREEARQAEAHAKANLRDAEARCAKTLKAEKRPQFNPWLTTAFSGVIAITVAPTLHDFVFHTLPDDLLSWFASLVSAACVACMLTVAILSGRRTAWTWAGVAAGAILGIGLGAVRLSSAEGPPEWIFAIGLTVVEIATVLLLEWLASGLRNSEDHWTTLHAAESEALAVRDAAAADLSRSTSLLQEVNNRIRGHILEIESRFNRNVQLPQLEADAVKAVLDGYNAGIAENIGRLRGALGGRHETR